MTKRWKTRSKTDGIILILTGILVLVVLIPTGSAGDRSRTKTQKATDSAESEKTQTKSVLTDDEYVKSLEEQLQNLIERMDGAGSVRVMLTLADDGLTHLDKNTKVQETNREETTVVYETKDKHEPYVIRQERPRVEGVVVVAQGGDRPGVVTEISDAIQSLFDLEAHKVKVVKMSVQEE